MDSFDDTNYSKLKEDVGKCFKTYSHIRNVNDILEVGHFILSINYDYNECDHLYLELYKWKRMSQLIMNLYNDYDIYQCLIVNLTTFKDVNSNYLVPDTHSRPSEKDVIQALYKYVLYFLLIQRKERKINWEKMIVGISLDNLKCWMCECQFELDELECSACSEPIENTIRNINIMNDVDKKTNSVGERKKLQLNSDYMNEENKMEGVDSEANSNDQWKCVKCGTLNRTDYLTCVSCYVSRPKTCEKCCMIYEASVDKCMECGHKNVDFNEQYCKTCHQKEVVEDGLCSKCLSTPEIKDLNRFNKTLYPDLSNIKFESSSKPKLAEDKWECKKCSLLNLQTFLSCTVCKAPRMEIWTCHRCTTENKISTNQCSGCLEYTKPWECRYHLCGNKNCVDCKFCQFCGFDRSYSGKDVLVKRFLHEKEDKIWICRYCKTINSIYLIACSSINRCCGKRSDFVKKCWNCYNYLPIDISYCEICRRKI